MTPEQKSLSKVLLNIFMPYTVSKMDEHYKGQSHALFIHYTSAEAAINIIKTKLMWMRNTTCMSDYSEVMHGFKLLNSCLEKNKDEFINTLGLCSENIGTEAINLFNTWWSDIQVNTYIISISEHNSVEDQHGRLSMWRAFGGKTARVGIVYIFPVEFENTFNLRVIVNPVAYLNEDNINKDIRDVLNNIKEKVDFLKSVDRQVLLNIIFIMLVMYVTCTKHEGFKEEREWRAVYLPNIFHSDLIIRATETINDVPQIVYKLPLDVNVSPCLSEIELTEILDRIIVGPSPYPWSQYEAFVDVLKRAGVKNAEEKVITSGIPIRA